MIGEIDQIIATIIDHDLIVSITIGERFPNQGLEDLRDSAEALSLIIGIYILIVSVDASFKENNGVYK